MVQESERLENALGRLGVLAEDVDLVVNTHLHWDNCSNNAAFGNAEILVQRAELSHAAAPCAGHHRAYRIHPGSIPPFALCLDRVRPLDGAAEVAPGIGVVPLPGHSPGSQGVHVRTGEGTFVITGDCVDTLENWENGGADHALPSGGEEVAQAGAQIGGITFYATSERRMASPTSRSLPYAAAVSTCR